MTKRIRYLVVADQGQTDVVVGSFDTIEQAREAVEIYNADVPDPFCWIEQSDLEDIGDSNLSRM